MKFIHKKSIIEGDVELGDNVSIWAFAVIRGDEGKIKIGDNTNIQEHVTIHGEDVNIGNNVTVGHGAVIHGAKIGNNVLIGIGAIILDGVEIGDWSIVAAGSVITPNTKIPSESIVMGVPAKMWRKTEQKDRDLILQSYKNYLEKIKNIEKDASGD